MEYRLLGNSGLRVSELCFGAGTFGRNSEFFKEWGLMEGDAAKRIVDLCVDAGINFFDTADVYSDGESEKVLGESIRHLDRGQLVIGTKATFRLGKGINDAGQSRHHLIRSIEGSLKRLGTDYIDVYYMHEVDAMTPIEETLYTLNRAVEEGKIRYIGCSNFSGWQLMKSLSISERYGWAKYVVQQSYYSLIGRDFEWELMPLGQSEKVGTAVWSPLGWARLTGKYSRNKPKPTTSRLNDEKMIAAGPKVADEHLYNVVDAIEAIAQETGKSVPEVSLNWLLQRPTVSTIIIGGRSEEQLKQNFKAVGWKLTPEQMTKLDEASKVIAAYPYWHQRQFPERNHDLL
ncbi:aldo/keto reductase [Terriglobus albidus]|uniref:Aldo/keto reductase n=1 Tax=Terriglobus albidus TaxID=1592106 RepID=A0A5B9EGU5_9BACT|nr:aldo/keto reductase [Terriglobus albidus]QEE31039.1 aldo/keto reductase [Terriglobus albidus]